MIRTASHDRCSTRLLAMALSASAAVLLSGCASSSADPAPLSVSSENAGHGYVEGAQEQTEPQLRIVYAGASGEVRVLDLLTETDEKLASVAGVDSAETDGRFFFAQRVTDSGTALAIIDSGVWTVDHEDHSHYYLATPAKVSSLTGTGTARVASSETVTAVAFAGESRARVIDRAALAEGEIVQLSDIDTAENASITPFGDGFVIDASHTASSDARVAAVDAAGEPLAEHTCHDSAGSATTNVGVVIGCAEGALLATASASNVEFEMIRYPDGTDAALRATEFDHRAGRPALGAVAGAVGAWQLDTRARQWTLIPSELPLLQVSAVGDDDRLLVAIDTAGRVVVLSAEEGRQIAASEPLVAASAGDAGLASSITLSVEASRAYVTGPKESTLFEIDYRDAARVSRSFALPIAPVAAELVG